MVPPVVIGFALLLFLSQMGLFNGFARLLCGHIIITVPYTIRATLAGISGIDRSLTEAALILGANERRAFWDITLPLARTGIVSGAIFAFAVSMDDVAVSIMLTDAQTYTLPIALISSMRANFDLTIAAASLMLMVMTLVLIAHSGEVRRSQSRHRTRRVSVKGKSMQATVDPVIKFDGVGKSFGAFTAVDGISFSAAAGETVALLGPSGCGKTTTLRLIAGFEEPDKGTIEISGESMAGKRPYERNVGLLFQHYALFPHMTVQENIAYGLKHRGWPKAEIADRVAEMLRLVQLESFADRRPRQMSGGQQQRVALARVLATKPKLVLLDEPLSALDAKLREELRVELKQILTAVGSTTIVVTHDQDEAMSLADRIIVMNRGRIEQQGAPDEIYSRPATSFVATFIGRTNWFHGTISAAKPSSYAHVVTRGGNAVDGQ